MTASDAILEIIKHLPGQHSQLKHAGIEHATTGKSIEQIRRFGLAAGSYVLDTDVEPTMAEAHHAIAVENIIAQNGRLSASDRVYIADLDLTPEELEESADIDPEFEEPVSFVLTKQVPPGKIKSVKVLRPSDELLSYQAEASLEDFVQKMPKSDVYSTGDPMYGGGRKFFGKLYEEGGADLVERRAAAKNYVDFLYEYSNVRKAGLVKDFDEYAALMRRKDEIRKEQLRRVHDKGPDANLARRSLDEEFNDIYHSLSVPFGKEITQIKMLKPIE